MDVEKIGIIFKDIFSGRKVEIDCVYIYGSLLNENITPDPLYEAKISGKLEKLFQEEFNYFKPIHVQILNQKSLRFLYSILKDAKIVCCNNEEAKIKFEVRVLKEFLDFKAHYDYYDVMRKLRYAS